jgi:hypothetical protein
VTTAKKQTEVAAATPPQRVAKANDAEALLKALKGDPRGIALRLGLGMAIAPTRFSYLTRKRSEVLERRWIR